MVVKCSICNQVFAKQFSLNRHKRNIHKQNEINIPSYEKDSYLHKCLEGCELSFRTISDLRSHLSEFHQRAHIAESLEFPSDADFENWLSDLSERENVHYVKQNRKFVPETESEERQRSLKSQGSCKIGASCTNQIIIKKTDGKCKVTYYKEHYGHPIELQHIPISKKNRNMLAAQLSSGVQNKKVLGNIRDNIGNKLKRIDLLDRKDLQNIKNSYNLKQDEGKLHKEDSISISIRSNVNNCVLLYKRQGEDHHLLEKDDFTLIFMNKSQEFMLKNYGGNIITVDSTHGLNPYDFELTTLLVLDEFGEGFPTACMFTNRKDTLVNEIFFSLIKNQLD
nr:unnamed protein product [Callosobruchus chinensis]